MGAGRLALSAFVSVATGSLLKGSVVPSGRGRHLKSCGLVGCIQYYLLVKMTLSGGGWGKSVTRRNPQQIGLWRLSVNDFIIQGFPTWGYPYPQRVRQACPGGGWGGGGATV